MTKRIEGISNWASATGEQKYLKLGILMGRMQDLVGLLIIVSIINQSFSAVIHEFRKTRNPNEDYKHLKSASLYRGAVLAYSPKMRIDKCNDVFPSKKPTTVPQGEPHPLLQATIVKIGTFQANEEDIFFNCEGRVLPKAGTSSGKILSSAFRPGIMYTAAEVRTKPGEARTVEIQSYVTMSPELVKLDRAQLEKQYVTIRRTLAILDSESPGFTDKLLGPMDDLLKFAKPLCESIISSPVYQRAGVKFVAVGNHNLRRKPLDLENAEYSQDKFSFSCVFCKITRKGRNTNLYITESFDDRNSVYVMALENEKIKLDHYFINVPVLMNLQDQVTAQEISSESDQLGLI